MLTQSEIAKIYNDVRIETPRLVLRNFVRGDRDVMIEHEIDPRIMKYIRDPLPEEKIDTCVEWLEKPWTADEKGWTALCVVRPPEDSMIGLISFRIVSYERQSVEIGYRFHPDYFGNGYASESTAALLDHLANNVRPHKFVAYCIAENDASYRVMERLGMTREGCLREHSMLGGVWLDELVYGLTAEDWLAHGRRDR